ncbi:MAG: acetate/propionate family kinase [Actinomycetota bacterium]
MTRAPGAVLAVNAGSSSLKASLFDARLARLARAEVERVGAADASLRLTGAGGEETWAGPVAAADHAEALARILDALARSGLPEPAMAGHRVVHGGSRRTAPAAVDAALLDELRDLARLAPLHMPAEIAAIEELRARHPGLPQVACFDTAFFRRLPEAAQRLPLPQAVWDAGVRRLGFHGLSYEYLLSAVPQARTGRAVLAHLGNGASMAAVRDGDPVDTTMGFTPVGGIMMGTRPGDLDPGVLVHLARHHGMDADALDRLVTRESGLLGVSGTSGDMRELLARRDTDRRAALAVEMFCARARREVGALAAELGGLDTLVFTAGIGERAAAVRAEICSGLGHLGVTLDPQRNARHDAVISAPGAAVTVRVERTDEDLMVARHTQALAAADAHRARVGARAPAG